MNTLSWLIYFADIFPRLIPFGVLLVFGSFLLGFVCPPKGVEPFSHKHYPGTGFGRRIFWVTLILGILFATLTPNRNTLYAIAASEMGEVVVKSEEAQEVFKALKDRVMDELKIEEKKD